MKRDRLFGNGFMRLAAYVAMAFACVSALDVGAQTNDVLNSTLNDTPSPYTWMYEQNGDGTITITGISPEPEGSLTIPSVIDGCSVTGIGEYAFSDCSGLTSVTIPDSVTSIGAEAFSYCRGLTSITIPGSVTNIGTYAFSYCSGLTSVTIPGSVAVIEGGSFAACSELVSVVIGNGVTSVGNDAFVCCSSLSSVSIPDSLTSIGVDAFGSCSALTSVTIPSSVTNIHPGGIFLDCSGLMSIFVAPDNVSYSSANGLLLSKDGTMLIEGVNGDVIVPGSVTFIGQGAFYRRSQLTSVMIPASVTGIGTHAFSGCGLTSVTIPDSVTSIGDYAFYDCGGLTSVTMRGDCPTLPEYDQVYGSGAFGDVAPSCVVYLPRGNETYDVVNGKWQGMTVEYYDSAPWPIVVHNVTFDLGGHGLRTGGGELTQTVTNGCAAVTPEVAATNGWRFEGWDVVFTNVTADITVTALYSRLSEWSASEWVDGILWHYYVKNGKAIVGVDPSVEVATAIPTTTQGAITVPSTLGGVSVAKIGEFAFQGCAMLTSVVIPEGITEVGQEAFSGCSQLEFISLPDAINKIGWCSFYGCRLEKIEIPQGINSIAPQAFENCTHLTNVVFTGNVRSIERGAFGLCTSLEEIVIPSSVTNIQGGVFGGCESLTNVTFEGNAPITEEVFGIFSASYNVGNSANEDCTVYVHDGSSGWGVDIPGEWQGVTIKYIESISGHSLVSVLDLDPTLMQVGGCVHGSNLVCVAQGETIRIDCHSVNEYGVVEQDGNGEIFLVLAKDFEHQDFFYGNRSEIISILGTKGGTNTTSLTWTANVAPGRYQIGVVGAWWNGTNSIPSYAYVHSRTIFVGTPHWEMVDGIYYEYTTDGSSATITLIGCDNDACTNFWNQTEGNQADGARETLTLPSTLGGLRVKSIDDCAWGFWGSVYSLDKIVVPDGVESIGAYALASGCYGTIVLPSSLRSVGEFALGGYNHSPAVRLDFYCDVPDGDATFLDLLGWLDPGADWTQDVYVLHQYSDNWSAFLAQHGRTITGYLDAAPEPQTHTVTFELGNKGRVRKGGGELVQVVTNGFSAVAPELTIGWYTDGELVEPCYGFGYWWVFTGWDATFSSVTSDTTVNATYELADGLWDFDIVYVSGYTIETNNVISVQLSSAEIKGLPPADVCTWKLICKRANASGYDELPFEFGPDTSDPANPISQEGYTHPAAEVLGNFNDYVAFQAVCTFNDGRGSCWSGIWQSVEEYAVVFNPGIHGALTGTVEQVVANGGTAYVPGVMPDSGYSFSGWDSDVTAPITSNAVFTAQYAPIQYGITYLDVRGGANANPTNYNVESRIDFEPLADVEGWQFKGWAPSFIPTGSVGNVTVTALWTHAKVVVDVGGVTSKYDYGDTATFTAPAAWDTNGMRIVTLGTTFTAPVVTNQFTVTVTNDISFGWDILATNWWLEVDLPLNGAIESRNANPVSVPGWIADGETAVLEAVPTNRFHFVRWTGDIEGCLETNGLLSVAMDRPRTIGAEFAIDAISMGEAVNAPTLLWTTSGDADWVGVWSATAADGTHAARSGVIGDSQETRLSVALEGAGRLSFDWRASCEEKYDAVRLEVDGELVRVLSGETGWTNVVIELGFGEHAVRWIYRKGRSKSDGEDAVWLDNVVWTAASHPTLADALGDFEWDTDGSALWTAIRSGYSCEGDSMAIAETPGDLGEAVLRTTMSGAGRIVFRWAVSCEEFYDWLYFAVDGEVVEMTTGETDWETMSVNLGDGAHVLEWIYWKDEIDDEGLVGADCAMLDWVQWYPKGDEPPDVNDQVLDEFFAWLKEHHQIPENGGKKLAQTTIAERRRAPGKSVTLYEEFVAKTNPEDVDDVFKATIEFVDDSPVVTPDPYYPESRKYTLLGKKNLDDPNEEWVEVKEGEEGNYNFFKVTVEMP